MLVRQERVAIGGKLLELPAGLIDEGEEPLESAKRELREETGLRGGQWRELTSFWSSPGFVNERVWVFAATGLDEGETEPDEGEELEIVRWPLSEVEARLAELDGRNDADRPAGLPARALLAVSFRGSCASALPRRSSLRSTASH